LSTSFPLQQGASVPMQLLHVYSYIL
jgi:hypothetical protein